MQYTPNYNLITVEGTDVVNPLVQMNPNFTNIDAAMYANKQAVIGTASEITSGTVHSITRANPDSNYFRFTATSNWTAGDSMSVDGVNVSVYLTDGTTPGTGAYVINSEVFAILNGTRLTVFTASSVSLDTLTDTDINSPAQGEALVFDGAKWANAVMKASDVMLGTDPVSDILNNLVSALGLTIAAINTSQLTVGCINEHRWYIDITASNSNSLRIEFANPNFFGYKIKASVNGSEIWTIT